MITYVIIGFLLLESANVLALYFAPDSKLANSVGVFKAWEKSKQDPEQHNLVRYLVNWVAGTKLIFILLLVVILISADDQSLVLTGTALVISILSFFWRLDFDFVVLLASISINSKNGSGGSNRS